MARRDADLMATDMVMRLAPPPAPGADFSWVKPGRVVWDFWADWNLEGVDFVAGRNNETIRYHIDFAAKHGFEYVNVDWLWSDPLDLFALNPDIDVPALVAYARADPSGDLALPLELPASAKRLRIVPRSAARATRGSTT